MQIVALERVTGLEGKWGEGALVIVALVKDDVHCILIPSNEQFCSHSA